MDKSRHDRRAARLQNRLVRILGVENYGASKGGFDASLAYLRNAFNHVDTVHFRQLYAGANRDIRVCLVTCDGLVNSEIVDNHLLRPLMTSHAPLHDAGDLDSYLAQVFQILSYKKTLHYEEMIAGITYGDTLLLLEGADEALLFDTKSFQTRAPTEPEGEKILSGPREGFTEGLLMNLTLLRRKLRTEKLKMRFVSLGRQTKTQVCVSYIDGIVKPQVVAELLARLKGIDIDGVLDANYINELIRDKPRSPFRTMGYTERPDVVAGKLLEGRVALFVDGTPVVLTMPYLFIENFQNSEDYYLNPYFTSFSRLMRIIGFVLTALLPGVFIAIVAYHQELLPASLIISVATERQAVPLPAALEALIMLVVFEILRETALRMQANVGQALSIVGALVVGQAAVEARLVAAPMLIVIAMTGITSLLVPKMNAPILIIRFGVLLLASCFGFLGVTIGCALTLIHILDLHSFGVWQLAGDERLRLQDMKDTVIRMPWYRMLTRPPQLTHNAERQRRGGGI